MSLFTKQSLDSIMSTFTKTLTNLEIFIENRNKDLDTITIKKQQLSAEEFLAQKEVEKASSYASNIKKMLNVT